MIFKCFIKDDFSRIFLRSWKEAVRRSNHGAVLWLDLAVPSSSSPVILGQLSECTWL